MKKQKDNNTMAWTIVVLLLLLLLLLFLLFRKKKVSPPVVTAMTEPLEVSQGTYSVNPPESGGEFDISFSSDFNISN